MWLRI